MNHAYVINCKSVALEEKIQRGIANNKIPSSLFRATLLNAIRKIRDGNASLVNYTALENAVHASLTNYNEPGRLRGYAKRTLRKIKAALENDSQANLDALLVHTGFIPACSIRNFKMLSVLLQRRIYDVEFITKIESMVGSLNSAKGELREGQYCLRHYSNNGTIPKEMKQISTKLFLRHRLNQVPAILSKIINEYGKKTLEKLGFSVERIDQLATDKYYVYYATYSNLTFPVPVSIKGVKIHAKKTRNRSSQRA